MSFYLFSPIKVAIGLTNEFLLISGFFPLCSSNTMFSSSNIKIFFKLNYKKFLILDILIRFFSFKFIQFKFLIKNQIIDFT